MIDEEIIKEWISNALIRKGLIDKSYSHKPHLAGLPYDRRSTNFDELLERYESCIKEQDKRKEKMDKLRDKLRTDLDDFHKIKKDLQGSINQMDGWIDDNRKFFDADEKVQKEKMEQAHKLENEFESIFFEMEDILDGLNKKETEVLLGLSRISGYFLVNGSSILPTEDVDEILKLADDYVDVLDKAWISFDKEQYVLADNLRDLTKNSKELVDLESNAHSVGEMIGLQDHINIVQHDVNVRKESIKKTKKQIDTNYNEWQDFSDERHRIANRCSDLGLL